MINLACLTEYLILFHWINMSQLIGGMAVYKLLISILHLYQKIYYICYQFNVNIRAMI